MENVKHMSVFATMLLIMLFAAPAGAGAQLSWQDNFDYPPGPLYGQGQWVKPQLAYTCSGQDARF